MLPSETIGYETWLGVLRQVEREHVGLVREIAYFARNVLERADDPEAIARFVDELALAALEDGD